MTVFAVLTAVLLVAVLAVLLRPLWRTVPAEAGGADRRAANLAIFRDQLAELSREQAEGSLAPADFEQARRELQKRLLEEVEGGPENPAEAAPTPAPARTTALALIVLVPLLALAGYAVLGQPRALDPAARVAQPEVTPAQITAMVSRLAERMAANPGDLQGWLMLGRSYAALGRYEDAVAAFAKGESAMAGDPDWLASYAETIALAKGEGFRGKPQQLIDQALKANPEHPHALFLAGAAAMERGDRPRGIAYWEKLLPMVEPGSDTARMIEQGLARMKAGR